MKAVIPMAGYGKRLRPHTYSRPKPLINVAGQPMLKYLLDALADLDIEEYIFIVGYLGDQIEEYVTKKFSIKAKFVEQKEMIGQAHAIYLAKDYLEGPLIVLFSDTLFQTDLSTLTDFDADALIFVKEVDDPRRFGVVIEDEAGKIVQFIEKPDSMEHRNAVIGLYYIHEGQELVRAIEEQMDRKKMTRGEFFIADAFQIMIEKGLNFKTQNVDVWLDCGKPETVLETNRWLLDNGYANCKEKELNGITIIPPVFIDPEAKIEHAIIGPYATISAGCEVSFAIIRDSILDTGAQVSYTLLEDSLIGRDAFVRGAHQRLNVGDSTSIEFDSK